MAETAMQTTEQKKELQERAHEANVIRRAMLGEIPWLSKEVVKPVAIAGAVGAVGVVSGRFFANKYFPNTDSDGEADDNAKTKRGAAKIALGLGGAALLKKMPAAAIGWAVGLTVDGVADIVEDSIDDKLHEYFDADGEDSRTPDGVAPADAASSSSETAVGAVRMRRVRSAY